MTASAPRSWAKPCRFSRSSRAARRSIWSSKKAYRRPRDRQFGTPLPDDTLKHAQDSDAILLGAVGGPKWDNPNADVRPEQALLGLRKALGLFANMRPVKTVKELIAASPLKAEIISGVDLVVIRELTGGIYYGKPSEKRDGKDGREAVDTCFYTEAEIARVLSFGFELARIGGRNSPRWTRPTCSRPRVCGARSRPR